MIHPDLERWQQAKRSAMLLAAHMGAEIIQSPDGETKTVILGKRVQPCKKWYAAYCWLHRIRLDQIETARRKPLEGQRV
jgi:hypothetical protein